MTDSKLPVKDELRPLGNNLLSFREQAGRSQSEIAESLGVTVAAYSRWELGKVAPDLKHLKAISDLYHVSIDYLVGHSKDLNIGNSECSKITGLSEISVEILRKEKRKTSPGAAEFIDILLRYSKGTRLRKAFRAYLEACSLKWRSEGAVSAYLDFSVDSDDLTQEAEMLEKDGFPIVSSEVLRKVCLQDLADAFKELFFKYGEDRKNG